MQSEKSTFKRVFAGLVAASAIVGLAIQAFISYGILHSAMRTLWVVLGYFTITTNILVAICFTAIAYGRRIRETYVAGISVSIILVGAVYAVLLHHLFHFHGSARVANTLLHQVTPIIVPIFWLCCISKGELTARDPLKWVLYPLAYLPYALVRGRFTQNYVYPFIDLHKLGWSPVFWNAVCLTACFLAAGYLFVGLDRVLGKRRNLALKQSSSEPNSYA